MFPPSVRFLCECHPGTIAEQPEQALSLLSRPGLEDVQIICHPFLVGAPKLERWLEAFGPRVAHMHVQLRDDERAVIRLGDKRPHLQAQVELLARFGFRGSWTIEFVHGTGTQNDEPDYLFSQACEDRTLLESLLNSASAGE
jgi:sugar phosphate isomerase/epimerase